MSLSHTEVEERISKIISERILPDAPGVSAIDADTVLLSKGLNLDSVAVLSLVVEIEDEFGIEFLDADVNVDLFANVGTLATYVSRQSQESRTDA